MENNLDEREYLSLDEVHAELLKLLLRFDTFCKKHSLRYSLDSGTLLGAVRHKGFIPWDDDVDLNMPRPDYERLKALQHELPDGLHFVDAYNSDIVYGFGKICTESVRAQEPSYEGVMDEMLWIDIFPTDGVDEDPQVIAEMKKTVTKAARRNVWANVNHQNVHGIKRLIKVVLGASLRSTDTRGQLLKAIERASVDPGYDDSKYVTCLVGTGKTAWRLSKDAYEHMVDMEFEGHMLPVMGCWDQFLSQLYGDYMKLPPVDKRATHCIKAWRVDE